MNSLSADATTALTQSINERAYRRAQRTLDDMLEDAAAKGEPVATVTELTPALARVLMERNPKNRRFSQTVADNYARDIKNGYWELNGETIVVADDGSLNNGQHRCSAVIATQQPMPVVLVVGVSRDSRMTLDRGRNRTSGDYLSMQDYANADYLAAAANYAWQYEKRGKVTTVGPQRASRSDVNAYVQANPDLVKSVDYIVGFKSRKITRKFGGVGFLAFCHFALSRVGREDSVASFFVALLEGAELSRGHPVLRLRNRLEEMAGGREFNGKVELVFKAWNHVCGGHFEVGSSRLSGSLPALRRQKL